MKINEQKMVISIFMTRRNNEKTSDQQKSEH